MGQSLTAAETDYMTDMGWLPAKAGWLPGEKFYNTNKIVFLALLYKFNIVSKVIITALDEVSSFAVRHFDAKLIEYTDLV